MPEYFQRPENALMKAQEFLGVNKKKAALDVLSDVLRSKKHRTWQKVHESIIFKYLDLCVDLKRSQSAKEGLYQYKNICQQVNPKSLEDAITHYLDQAEEQTKNAKLESAQTALKMVEDLDMIDTPEEMLLKAVTGEQTQDRTDRKMLTPWVKYLWESYRQVLDLLRNNCRVEKLYHLVARRAFIFCLDYERRTEFRKLCDNLRNHVKLSEQRHNTLYSVNLTNPETQMLHLETKISQLDASVKIELWQEAFKAVEDIHYLMSLSKRPPKPQTLANFFVKLSLVFWKADSMLFHACSRHRLFRLTKDMKKNPTKEDLTRMASLLLVATLAIPIVEQKHGIGKILDMEGTLIDKHLTLSKLLGLDRPPTRKSLLEDFMKYNLLEYVPRQLKDLYKWLENDFHPLKLAELVSKSLNWINEQTKEPELRQYIEPLQAVVICRVLQQVAQLYQTIKFDRLLKLLPFCSAFQLEQTIMDAARNGQLQARIDHNRGCILFGTDLNASPLYVEDEFFEVDRLQSLPSERVSESFNQMTKSLMLAYRMLNKEAIKERDEKTLNILVNHYNKTKVKEHQKILKRKYIIEERKEQIETMNMERELREQRLVQEQEEKVKVAEKARITKEQQEREARRREEQEKEEKRRTANDRLEMFKKSEIGQKILKDIDIEALEKINPDELMKRQVETLEKEKRELHDRLKAQEKKLDYFERAKRLEEIPLLKQKAIDKKKEDAELWEKLEDERIENLKTQHQNAIETRNRLARIVDDKNDLVADLEMNQLNAYMSLMETHNERLDKIRKERLIKRRLERKLARFKKRKEEKIQEAYEKEQQLLKLKLEREEQMRIQREEEARQLQEERQRKLREQQEKQRERDLEVERKLAARHKPIQQQQATTASWRTRDDNSRNSWRMDRNDDSPSRSNQQRSQAYRPPSYRYNRADEPRGFDNRRQFDRDGPPYRNMNRDTPSRFNRDLPPRSFERPTPHGAGRDDWRRRSPSPRQDPSGSVYRRSSPPGRRSSPPGRSDSPPRARRASPTGRKSSPPSKWRSEAPRPQVATGNWRASRAVETSQDGQGDGGRTGRVAEARPYRPQRAEAPRRQIEPTTENDKPLNQFEEDGEWTEVRRR